MSALLIACLLSLESMAMPPDDVVERFADRACVYTGGEYDAEEFHFRLLAPERIEPGQTYPVVLFLHGAGERGTDNRLQLLYLPELLSQPERRAKYPCFLIAPQCRPDKQWVDVPWGAAESTPLGKATDQLQAALGMLEQVLETEPVDRRRVYLTGLSMGGYGCWDLAARRPEWFAAVAPICGGGDEAQADRLAGIPIWAFHGAEDGAVPVVRSRRMIAAIRAAGGQPRYSELEGVGHNSWTPAYSDPDGLIPWMFEQVRAERSP